MSGLGSTISTIEPGFQLVLAGLLSITHSPILAIRGIAILYGFLITYYALKSSRTELIFLLSVYFPAFYFPHGMNVLRIGLASALLLLATQFFARRRFAPALLTAILAVTMHYSSALVLVLLVGATSRGVAHWKRVTAGIGIFAGLLVFIAWNSTYISNKLGLYAAYDSPSALSGTRPLLLILLMLIAAHFSRIPAIPRTRMQLLVSLATIFGAALSAFSYAGLRVLELVAFSAPLILVMLLTQYRIRLSRSVLVLFLTAGTLYAAVTFRGFLIEASNSATLSPFLPYHALLPWSY